MHAFVAFVSFVLFFVCIYCVTLRFARHSRRIVSNPSRIYSFLFLTNKNLYSTQIIQLCKTVSNFFLFPISLSFWVYSMVWWRIESKIKQWRRRHSILMTLYLFKICNGSKCIIYTWGCYISYDLLTKVKGGGEEERKWRMKEKWEWVECGCEDCKQMVKVFLKKEFE